MLDLVLGIGPITVTQTNKNSCLHGDYMEETTMTVIKLSYFINSKPQFSLHLWNQDASYIHCELWLNQQCLFFPSFCGSGIWDQFSWVLAQDSLWGCSQNINWGYSYLKTHLTRAKGYASNVTQTHGWLVGADCWQGASFPLHMDLSMELSKCLYHMDPGFL